MAANVPRKKVAIVGTGCSGIAALWALNRSHHDVYIYEAADRLGGHTNTVSWCRGKYTTQVDAGFIVMNTATYPNFLRFLRRLGVQISRCEMNFSVSRDHGAFEWAGANFDTIFCQFRNFFSPRMWRMLFDIVRFNYFALDFLEEEPVTYVNNAQESIGDYLRRNGYSDAFRDDYLIPMTAAVWSTKSDKCTLDFPAAALIRFLWNHHLLSTSGRQPDWLTIESGAKSYIDAVTKGFPRNHMFLNTPVRSVTNEPDGRVRVHVDGGRSDVYDHVILATHGDEALSIVKESATPEEEEILSSFHTTENVAVLHSDAALMPVSRRAWSGWNYQSRSSRRSGRKSIDQVSVTYNMNILQHIPTKVFGNVLVTLNPLTEPNPATVQGVYRYTHPIYTAEAVRGQKLLPRIQNRRGIIYVGAWTNYGFHEDGFTSGLVTTTEYLGAKVPFRVVDSSYSRGRVPRLSFMDYLMRLLVWFLQVFFIETFDRVYGVIWHPRPVLLNSMSLKKWTKKAN